MKKAAAPVKKAAAPVKKAAAPVKKAVVQAKKAAAPVKKAVATVARKVGGPKRTGGWLGGQSTSADLGLDRWYGEFCDAHYGHAFLQSSWRLASARCKEPTCGT